MKMRISALLVNAMLIFGLSTAVITETACGAQDFGSVVTRIQGQIPAAEAAAKAVLAVTDPAVLPLVDALGATVETDLGVLKGAIAAWQASPSQLTRDKITATIDELVNAIDGKVLELNRLGTKQSGAALLVLATLSSVIHIIDGFVISGQTKVQATAHATQHSAKLAEVMPLMDRRTLEQSAQSQGVSLDEAVRYERALGF